MARLSRRQRRQRSEAAMAARLATGRLPKATVSMRRYRAFVLAHLQALWNRLDSPQDVARYQRHVTRLERHL